jgi:hypothetical protein
MRDAKNPDPILESFRTAARKYEEGDVTVREMVNKVLVDLAASERFDLVEETVRLLPEPIRDELRRAVADVLQVGCSYGGLFIIGRASEEWWARVRRNVKQLAEILRPALETPIGSKGSNERQRPEDT